MSRSAGATINTDTETAPLIWRAPRQAYRPLSDDDDEGCCMWTCRSVKGCIEAIPEKVKLAIILLVMAVFYVLGLALNNDTCSGIHHAAGTVFFEANATRYNNVRFDIKGGMYGIITVKEAESPIDKNIRMNILVEATNEDILNKVMAKTTPYYQSGDFGVVMDVTGVEMTLDACARANIVISYPRAISSSKELSVMASHGTFDYNLSRYLLNIQSMIVHLDRGSINVRGSIRNSVDLRTGNGPIVAQLLTRGKVMAEVTSGSIDLDIDSATPRQLDISARSHSNDAQVRLREVFEGHFSIESGSGGARLSPRRGQTDQVHYVVDEQQRKVGWISRGRSRNEPSSALPRVDVFSSSGQAILDLW